MVYGQESVFAIAVALPLWLLVAYLIGQLARWLLRGRVSLSTSATTVIAVLGVSGGCSWVASSAAWTPSRGTSS